MEVTCSENKTIWKLAILWFLVYGLHICFFWKQIYWSQTGLNCEFWTGCVYKFCPLFWKYYPSVNMIYGSKTEYMKNSNWIGEVGFNMIYVHKKYFKTQM